MDFFRFYWFYVFCGPVLYLVLCWLYRFYGSTHKVLQTDPKASQKQWVTVLVRDLIKQHFARFVCMAAPRPPEPKLMGCPCVAKLKYSLSHRASAPRGHPPVPPEPMLQTNDFATLPSHAPWLHSQHWLWGARGQSC